MGGTFQPTTTCQVDMQSLRGMSKAGKRAEEQERGIAQKQG